MAGTCGRSPWARVTQVPAPLCDTCLIDDSPIHAAERTMPASACQGLNDSCSLLSSLDESPAA